MDSTQFISAQEADVLLKAIVVCKDLEERAMNRDTDHPGDNYRCGIIVTRADQGGDGIFDLLNCLSSHMHSEVARDALDAYFNH